MSVFLEKLTTKQIKRPNEYLVRHIPIELAKRFFDLKRVIYQDKNRHIRYRMCLKMSIFALFHHLGGNLSFLGSKFLPKSLRIFQKSQILYILYILYMDLSKFKRFLDKIPK